MPRVPDQIKAIINEEVIAMTRAFDRMWDRGLIPEHFQEEACRVATEHGKIYNKAMRNLFERIHRETEGPTLEER